LIASTGAQNAIDGNNSADHNQGKQSDVYHRLD
jgi:hypothetical protein